ncbi:hypothetical protein QR680_015049 [Steinernema hermaphroditum]|uniref:Uncharacterized protein n=1 Tax=Steinernema hermaphroditum TaxID=289476 RepID=A0AA39ID85_9BILA|nr:hypothetical protein QR680_015049 [Steinernema hermaphroditum]
MFHLFCSPIFSSYQNGTPMFAISMSQITSSLKAYKSGAPLDKLMSSIMIASCLLSVFPYSPSPSPQDAGGSVEVDIEEKRRRNRIKQQRHYQQVKERRKECELKLEALASDIEQLRRSVEKTDQNAQFLRDRDCPFHTPGDVFHFSAAPVAFAEPDSDEQEAAEPVAESPVTPESKKRDKQRRFRRKVDNLEKAIQKGHKEVRRLKDYLEETTEKRRFYQKMVSECWSQCNKIHLIELNAVLQGY